MLAATSPVIPIATPPHPGTAVKDAQRSMVSRIKRRFSIACWRCRGERNWDRRSGSMAESIIPVPGSVKYFVAQSHYERRLPTIMVDKLLRSRQYIGMRYIVRGYRVMVKRAAPKPVGKPAETFLPLTPAVFHILLALAD